MQYLIDLFTIYDAILAGAQNVAKITVNVWDFCPLKTVVNATTKGQFSTAKIYFIKDICTEIIFIKYKEEIQAITTVNEFLRSYTNPSNQHYANYHEIGSLRFYGRRTFLALFSVE